MKRQQIGSTARSTKPEKASRNSRDAADTAKSSDRENRGVQSSTHYFIIYKIRRSGIEIARVVHGARDWPFKG
jgi:plasmid stabilization system protein ParE